MVRVQALEPIQDDDSAVKKYGVDLCVQMCRDLLAAGTPGVHFYTLNLEKAVTQILEDLDLIAASRPSRALPWRSVRASLAGALRFRFRFSASSFVLSPLFLVDTCTHVVCLHQPEGEGGRAPHLLGQPTPILHVSVRRQLH
jgi:hypothetical protein